MWDIGFMLWRIGGLLGFEEQVEWIRSAGFDAISFHASPGVPGKWTGIDPSTATSSERARLRGLLSGFSMREVHAPFAYELTTADSETVIQKLRPIADFAAGLEASILTVHATPPADTGAAALEEWSSVLDGLASMASESGTVIGLELMRGFECSCDPSRAGVGITLDVGHMYLNECAGLKGYGSLGALVRSIGAFIVHLHVHDYDGANDHVAVGSGMVDFAGLVESLADIHYNGALCLELNPDRVEPSAIRDSRLKLAELIRQVQPG